MGSDSSVIIAQSTLLGVSQLNKEGGEATKAKGDSDTCKTRYQMRGGRGRDAKLLRSGIGKED